jgi:PAS domain-containing protein
VGRVGVVSPESAAQWSWPGPGHDLEFDERLRRIHGWAGLSRFVSVERWRATVHRDDQADFDAMWAAVATGAVAVDVRLRIERADGEIRQVVIRGGGSAEPAGQSRSVRGTVVDVTVDPGDPDGAADPPDVRRPG